MKAKKIIKKKKTIKMLSKKRDRTNKQKEPCFFLEKLYNILKNKKNNNIIKWNEDGTKIIILDSIKFSNTILPKYFKHDNYSSFIRQLNIYGFRKITNIYKSKKEQFYNENFRRDYKIEEIRNIRRKDLIYDNSEEEELKEEIILLEGINKEDDDETKIEEYKKMIENGNMNIKSNIHILEFLFKKNKETDIFYDKIKNEISELINNNNINLQNMNNNLFKDDKNISFKNNTIEKRESFTLNENKKLLDAFKNVPDNIIEKKEPNKLNSSFCDDLSIFEGNSKVNLNPKIPSQIRTSYILLNKSGILIEPKCINNNDNTILNNNNMTNSFL